MQYLEFISSVSYLSKRDYGLDFISEAGVKVINDSFNQGDTATEFVARYAEKYDLESLATF